MRKYITYIYLSLFLLSLGYSQEIRTEILRTDSIINVPAGQRMECLSAEGKYTYDTYLGNFSIYKGPRLKITKDSAEFIYAVAPIGIDDFQGIHLGIDVVERLDKATEFENPARDRIELLAHLCEALSE